MANIKLKDQFKKRPRNTMFNDDEYEYICAQDPTGNEQYSLGLREILRRQGYRHPSLEEMAAKRPRKKKASAA